jgi:hypothetical protein
MISIGLYMCHYIKKSKVIILLETKKGVAHRTTKGKPTPLKKTRRMTWQQAKSPTTVAKDLDLNGFSNIIMVQTSNLV